MIETILIKTWQHLLLSLSALLLATLISIPLALWLARSKRGWVPALVLRSASLIQTIPGLAMLALIVVFLSLLPLPATGFLPGLFALSTYAVMPILSNTYTGIKQVSPTMSDVAKGLGMTKKQILFQVELPNSIPLIMSGIRISGVWTIGMGTLASLVGAGGLGDLIMQGLRSMQVPLVIAGTLPSICLAVFFDYAMTRVEKWLTLGDPCTS